MLGLSQGARGETVAVLQRTLSAAGFEPIVYRQPWNRESHPFIEVGDWQELENLIAF